MDLLASRYADPSFLLDGYISGGRLCEFILEFLGIQSENKTWEFYLHKIWDVSWEDYKSKVISKPAPEINKKELETTVSDSFNILKNFNPL